MRIAIDGYDLTRRPTGVGRYLRNLLSAILAVDSGNTYHLFLREDPGLFDRCPNLEKTIIPAAGGYSRWQSGPLRKRLAKGDYAWLFAPGNQLPFCYGGKSALAVHDVAWRAQAGDFSLKERTGKDLKCRWSLGKAARIYTDAEFTRQELSRYYGVPAERIQAIPLAIEAGFRREQEAKIVAFRERHRLAGKKVIGFLGSIFRRRHVRELIQACERLRARHDLALVIVGRNFAGREMDGWLRREGITWLEWLPEDQLNSFYSALDLFVYISSYEGFGFPPLEALACGTVPLLLPSSSLQELYGDLALFVGEPDPGKVAAAIDGFLADPGRERDRIGARWRERRGFFTWPRVAAAYLETLLG